MEAASSLNSKEFAWIAFRKDMLKTLKEQKSFLSDILVKLNIMIKMVRDTILQFEDEMHSNDYCSTMDDNVLFSQLYDRIEKLSKRKDLLVEEMALCLGSIHKHEVDRLGVRMTNMPEKIVKYLQVREFCRRVCSDDALHVGVHKDEIVDNMEELNRVDFTYVVCPLAIMCLVFRNLFCLFFLLQ